MSNFFKFIKIEDDLSVTIESQREENAVVQVSVLFSSRSAITTSLYLPSSQSRAVGEALIAAADAFDAAKPKVAA